MTDGEDKFKDSMNLDSTPSFSGTSRDPVLHNITDHLIEEASAEEEKLLGALASEAGVRGRCHSWID